MTLGTLLDTVCTMRRVRVTSARTGQVLIHNAYRADPIYHELPVYLIEPKLYVDADHTFISPYISVSTDGDMFRLIKQEKADKMKGGR